MRGLHLPRLVEAVSAYTPDTVDHDDGWAAATSLVIARGDGVAQVLFIERVTRSGDRWSGQMALPGGKRDPEDRDLHATAVRETMEEVGVELPPAVGRLDDLRNPSRKGRVATYVHVVDGLPPTTPEPGEVASVVWIGLDHLFDQANAKRYFYKAMGPFAGIEAGRHTVWGLTYGTLENFARVIGHPLPRPRGPLLG